MNRMSVGVRKECCCQTLERKASQGEQVMEVTDKTYIVDPWVWVSRQTVQSDKEGESPEIFQHGDDGPIVDGF